LKIIRAVGSFGQAAVQNSVTSQVSSNNVNNLGTLEQEYTAIQAQTKLKKIKCANQHSYVNDAQNFGKLWL
jgi:hypothetical protein